MNNQIRDLDALALFSSFLGVLNYMANTQQISNDELMEEIKVETNKKLDLIIEQNEEIIRRLKDGL